MSVIIHARSHFVYLAPATKNKCMNKALGMVTAVAAGVAAGSILGLLLAPAKGVETRKRLGRQGEKFVGAVDGAMHRSMKMIKRLKRFAD